MTDLERWDRGKTLLLESLYNQTANFVVVLTIKDVLMK